MSGRIKLFTRLGASGKANGKGITIYGSFEFGISRNQEEHLKVERVVAGVVRALLRLHSVSFRLTQPQLPPQGKIWAIFRIFFSSCRNPRAVLRLQTLVNAYFIQF